MQQVVSLPASALDAPAAPVAAIPVLLLRRGPVPFAALSALEIDERFAFFPIEELSAEMVRLGKRLSGLMVATTGDPFELLVYAASALPRMPIIMCITGSHAAERQDLLTAGASACITMPVRRRDLDMLLPVLTSRANPASFDTRSGLLLDAITRQVRYQGRTAQLTPREFAVLHHLLSVDGSPVSANDLLSNVWNDQGADTGRRRLVEVYVFHLRRKLERLGVERLIRTVRGYGYALEQGVTAIDSPA